MLLTVVKCAKGMKIFDWLLLHDYFFKCTSAPSVTDVCVEEPKYYNSVQYYSLKVVRSDISAAILSNAYPSSQCHRSRFRESSGGIYPLTRAGAVSH